MLGEEVSGGLCVLDPPKSCSVEVDVRALCRTLNFFHSNGHRGKGLGLLVPVKQKFNAAAYKDIL